jgi:tRNA threonylcarbamoyladenosine biosynthesis protein TsaB
MRILAIETSGSVGSVALCEAAGDSSDPARGLRTLRERTFTEGLIHGRELAPAVKDLLDGTRLRPADLDLIAVSQGPGSYTGLRVGIAFAKTFAWSLGKPLVGAGSLAAMAENAAGATVAAPVLDARWGQVYGAVYRCEAGRWREAVAPEAAAAAAFAERIPAGAAVFGSALQRYRDALLRPGTVMGDTAWAIPRASVVARLGLASWLAVPRNEARTLVPHYLRPTEAEVNAGLKTKGGPP